ncbi:MFS transporter [uncultured Bacteroides sp.]|uniref:MFS transporter n=1 Tax=uncultured Bacteroides sp. TaxID=162156 RepID=UPI002637FC36|nr:MFS transporter [uncultured Bacteroides sp.]
MLWNRNFSLLITANFLLYIAVYMLFPLLHQWMVADWNCTSLEAAGMIAIFGVALFLPGIFNNYLVDAFARKTVCTRSILGIGILTLLYPYMTAEWMVVVLRLLQGALFGIALMATGSTLVIDVTPSNNRNSANRVFTWSGILGLLVGLFVGVCGHGLFPFAYLLYFSAALCLLAVILDSLVEVPFRAPLGVPVCSLDRFFLFRTFLPGLNMMTVPMVLGMLFSSITDTFFYLCIGVGFLIYLIIRLVFTRPMNGRLQIFIGQLLTAAGLMALLKADGSTFLYVGGVLVGVGAGFSIGQFLKMMIMLPLHCERGTGYHTYQLLWELGVMIGLMLGMTVQRPVTESVYVWAMFICLIGFVFYQVFIHSYFNRNYKIH